MNSILHKLYKTVMALSWKIKYQGEIFVEKKGIGNLTSVTLMREKKNLNQLSDLWISCYLLQLQWSLYTFANR